MGREHFVRDEKPKHYPRWCAPLPGPDPALTLERRTSTRPGRFPVGLDERPLQPPRDEVNGTPLSAAAYVGRVEEVDGEGEVIVRAWARPSAREELMTLDTYGRDERGPYFDRAPASGDLVWIWKWKDVSKEHGMEERVHVEVERRELSDDDRARLCDLLAKLKDEER
jgi:hypothetical protein